MRVVPGTKVGVVGCALLLMVLGVACGSSNASSSSATPTTAPAAGSPTSAAATQNTTDPCSLLTDAEVRTVAPGVRAGTVTTVGGSHQICEWKDANGIPSVQLQVLVESSSPRESLTQQLGSSGYTIIDVAGVGDAAAAAFQQADPAHGLTPGLAFLDAQGAGGRIGLSTPGLDIRQGTPQFTQVTHLASTALGRLGG